MASVHSYRRVLQFSCLLATIALANAMLAGFTSAARAADTGPRVPSFQRFHADGKDPTGGGMLLLGELNCISCHKAADLPAGIITTKQAPVLDLVGERVRPEYLRKFLADPIAAKPGTTMPHVLGNLPEKDRADVVESLVHFLASTGSIHDSPSLPKNITAGEKLFHTVGCLACHDPQNGTDKKPFEPLATSLPLRNLSKKYTVPSLAAFLKEPHKVRPSGRMPDMNLEGDEPLAIASYLLRDIKVPLIPLNPKLKYSYYEGNFEKVPNFDKLTPKATGITSGFDISVAQRANDFALRFEGDLEVKTEGNYAFELHSDDGSKLWVGDKLVVDHDGIHAPAAKSGAIKLKPGVHKLVVGMFNGGGGAELRVEYFGPNMKNQPVDKSIKKLDVPMPEKPTEKKPDELVVEEFILKPELVNKGREHFVTLGCASCHQLKENGNVLASKYLAPSLVALKGTGGCLAEMPAKNAPNFAVNATQRKAIQDALSQFTAGKAPVATFDHKTKIDRTLTTFNCYACHARDGKGGVEEARNDFFATTEKEMGDEARIPPLLTGVGAKLNPEWTKKLLASGAKDRKYMLTKMPKFGDANVGHLPELFDKTDVIEKFPEVDFGNLPVRKVKETGWQLSGTRGVGCVQCHNFAGNPAKGIHAIDMTTMTTRLKRDWFHRYMVEPTKYRPGTRMPTAWPEGKSVLPGLLDGSSAKQIESIWAYLLDKDKAALPRGIGKEPIELVASTEAVIYRNFIEGASPRGIGVGYPEKTNIVFDANELCIPEVWHGPFIDASKHWTDRGSGYQRPMGGNLLNLTKFTSIAVLPTTDAKWPEKSVRGNDQYKFRGYKLDKLQRPTFMYEVAGMRVEDFPAGIVEKDHLGLSRKLTLSGEAVPSGLYFRAAVGKQIVPQSDGWYGVDKEFNTQITGGKPIIRTVDGKTELLVPITDAKTEIVQKIVW